jgi:anaerobic carbon-monoxide dehydrogenase iron sulfur subunit
MADHVLITDSRVCTGCRTCEIVCSLSHDGEINPHESRIRILQEEGAGLDVPVVCQQCSYAICRHVCSAKAISRDAETGAMRIDSEKCTGCEICVYACFFGAIKLRKVGKKRAAVVCDLCGGDPMCAKFCDTRAVAYLPGERVILEKKSESMRDTLFHIGRITSNSRESRLLERITAVRGASTDAE